jgi:hypothetical protein
MATSPIVPKTTRSLAPASQQRTQTSRTLMSEYKHTHLMACLTRRKWAAV